jgi:hypothetical protein
LDFETAGVENSLVLFAGILFADSCLSPWSIYSAAKVVIDMTEAAATHF